MKIRNAVRKYMPAPLRALSHDRSGEAGGLDTAIKIIIAIVLGALFLGFIYLLFKNNVFPTVTTKINDMFNYSGS